jgi:glycine cleavage system aminomethyltransferase T
MRDRAAMFDLTAFSIFDVHGLDALEVVQRVCARQMDVPAGRVVYTPVLTPSGTFKSDLTVMRLHDELFRVVTGGAHGMADKKWFADHLVGDSMIHDVTSEHTTIGLWGPRARDILSAVTSDDVSNDAFPFSTWKLVHVGEIGVLASRISYVGDLGWELYVPMKNGAAVWDAIWEAGQPHGIVPAGIGVYGTTGRLEKAYRAFGFELDADYTVVEADMAWWKVKSEDFVGKEAHLSHREAEPIAKLCTLTIDDHMTSSGMKRYPLGREPVTLRDGTPLTDAHGRRSYVTSAGAGPSLGKHIVMSYLPPEHANEGEQLAVEYMTELLPATVDIVGSKPPFDPDNERIRS